LSIPSRTSTERRALDLEDQHPKLRTFLSKRRKRLKILREENKNSNMPLTLKDQTFRSRTSVLMRMRYLTVIGEENKLTNCALDPEDWAFKSKIKTFKSKINLSK